MVTMVGLLAGGCLDLPAKGDVPLAKVDLHRVYGGWYIVALMPNPLDHGLVGSYDVFSPAGPRGRIHEEFYFWKGGFGGKRHHFSGNTITVLPDSGDADWRVQPIWPVSLPFQIVHVDPDYRFLLFGEQNREWGWIYSRSRDVSPADYASLLGEFRRLGWDTSRFRKGIQTESEIGAPGFWSDGVVRRGPDEVRGQAEAGAGSSKAMTPQPVILGKQ